MATNDGLLVFVEQDLASVRKGIEMMEKGTFGTAESERGRKVDTTRETLAVYRDILANLENVRTMLIED